MRQALTKVDGVVSAAVSYEEERAEIRYQPDLTNSAEMIFRHRRRGINREPLGVEMLDHRLPAVTSLLSAGLAASCYILPMAFIAGGLASAGLMMSMMRYEWLTLPLGVAGLAGAFVAHTRRRQQCATNGGRFVGQRLNQLFLILGTIVVVASLLLRVFPSWTSQLLAADRDARWRP